MIPVKMKHTQIESARATIAKGQNYICPICDQKFGPRGKIPALDHDHKTGYIRDVLCLWCNGMLGKVENASQRAVGKGGDLVPWLIKATAYLKKHKTPAWSIAGVRRGLIHPTFTTPEDKRLKRLKKATDKRRRAKALRMLKGK